ncbi:MAG: c-type cytochrome [Nitrospira sp. CR1.3]|nr:c-type cytochrome [Nitrospira sp. CR1.3]
MLEERVRFDRPNPIGTPHVLALTAALTCGVVIPSPAAEQHMMQPRVPADKLAEARALTSPLTQSSEIIERGKALYHGKGTCFNCHGTTGAGDGPASTALDPSPRNFQHHGFWRHRTQGEIFWVVKHGSPGTSMIGFGDQLSDEEIWSIIQYERSFAGSHRPGMMGHGKGMMGPGGGMGGMEHHEPRGGMGGCEGDRCDR